MRKIINIALIFTLIGVFLWPNLSYSEALRVPFDTKYGRLKILNEIIGTVGEIFVVEGNTLDAASIENILMEDREDVDYEYAVDIITSGMMERIKRGEMKLLVALEKETLKPAGYIIYKFNENSNPPASVQIIRSYTFRDHRRKGVNRLLVECCQVRFDRIRVGIAPDSPEDGKDTYTYMDIRNARLKMYKELGFIEEEDGSFVWIKPGAALITSPDVWSSL